MTASPFPGDPEPALCDDSAVVGLEDAHTLLRHVHAKAHTQFIPLNVSLELTQTCNIRCVHCYNFDRDQPKAARAAACGQATPDGGAAPKRELALPEILSLLADLRAAGCLFLSLTGGEVLTFPHLFAVLDRARELNLAVQLLTNGTLLRPGVAARLASYRNLLGVSISLYGGTPEVHDGITQVRGSWRRTWDGARRLKALGISVRLKLIIMKANAHEVETMRVQATEGGFPYMADLTITGRHDGDPSSLATRIDDVQLERLYDGPLRDFLPQTLERTHAGETSCNCARGNCGISAYGDVYPCIAVPWTAGNVRAQPFAEIWRTSPVFQRIRGLRLADYKDCAPCGDKAFCSRNRGAAFNASGSYTGTDPFVCRTAAITRKIAARMIAERQEP
jgi:radical SAM protein with 4Fe4S-binding SPASM domain